MEEQKEDPKSVAAAGAITAGFTLGGPVGGVAAALVVCGIFGVAALWNRKSGNDAHTRVIQNYVVRSNAVDIVITNLENATNVLNSQKSQTAEQISRYERLCSDARSQYDLTKQEYNNINNAVVMLEAALKHSKKPTLPAPAKNHSPKFK
ncbi:MAG: hypothetical protein M3R00_06980 [Pseudomonadota bacterium]|nr:hypothetical protein [Pseudomonadota bacterium]